MARKPGRQIKLRNECLDGEIFYSLREVHVIIEKLRIHYNTHVHTQRSATGQQHPSPSYQNQSLSMRRQTCNSLLLRLVQNIRPASAKSSDLAR
jgi:hypothetical protein